MPTWKIHDKWAQKLGIPEEVSKYTNGIIDARKLEDYPEDFSKYVDEVKISRPRGRVPFSVADLLVIFHTHDFGKKASMKTEVLPFFRAKGRDYVKAWYAHFILDYLVDLKDWMKNTGESIEDCIDKYLKNRKATVILGTKEQLIEVMSFLKRNSEELQKDIYKV